MNPKDEKKSSLLKTKNPDKEKATKAVTELNDKIDSLSKENASLQKKLDSLETEARKIVAEKESYLANLKTLSNDYKALEQRAEVEKNLALKKREEQILLDFCEILDDFERAASAKKDDSFVKGVENIVQKLIKKLSKNDVVKIEVADSEAFDPSHHEALAVIPSDLPKDKIVSIIQNGYKMAGKVIRYTRVVVSTGTGQ
jgi:molecular chaperone GrpE